MPKNVSEVKIFIWFFSKGHSGLSPALWKFCGKHYNVFFTFSKYQPFNELQL
jgi:hypothetical protein